MWFRNMKNEMEFMGGKNRWEIVEKEAEQCSAFKFDVEDEVIEAEVVACYNCRFRRWTEKSFVCKHSSKIFEY